MMWQRINRKRWTGSWIAIAAALGGWLLLAQADAQRFYWTGTFGGRSSEAYDVSEDGSVVVGWTFTANGQRRAFRWTRHEGIQDLGTLGGNISEAYAISRDGRVVVGYSNDAAVRGYPFRWTASTGMQALGSMQGQARGISADGSIIVATLMVGSQPWAYRWTEAAGFERLSGFAPEVRFTAVANITPDGQFIIGRQYMSTSSVTLPFRWHHGTVETLPILEGGWANALDISANGRVVVGQSRTADGRFPAVRWVDGAIQNLGIPGQSSVAYAVSGDGALIVGSYSTPQGARAFIWDEQHGMRDLTTLYASVIGEGAILYAATQITLNGRYIVGYGYNPETEIQEGFLLDTIPEPLSATMLLVGLGMLMLSSAKSRRASYRSDNKMRLGDKRVRWLASVVILSLAIGTASAQDRFVVEWRRFPNYAISPTFSPDNQVLAVVQDRIVYMRAVATWNSLFSFLASSVPTRWIQFSPDGRYLATTGDDGIIRLWDTRLWTQVRTFSVAPDQGQGLAFGANGRRLAAMGYRLRVWDVDTGNLLFELPRVSSSKFAFAPNGRYLAANPADTGSVQVFDVDTGQQLASFTPADGLQLDAIAFSPDSRLLAYTSRNRTYLISTDTWQLLSSFVDYSQVASYTALAFSPDSQLLYAAGGTAYEGGQTVYPFRIWRVRDLRLLASLPLSSAYVINLSVSPDGNWVAVGSYALLQIIDTTQLIVINPPEYMDRAHAMAIAPSGLWYVTGDSQRWATRRNALTGERLYRTPEGGHIDTVLAVAISPDEARLATGGADSRICIWNAEAGALLRIISGHLGAVLYVAFLGDGSTLLSVSADGTIRRWETATGTQMGIVSLGMQIHSAHLSADGQWLAVGAQDRRVRLFRVADLTLVAQTERLSAIPNSIRLSPTGNRVAVGISNGRLLMFNAPHMNLLFERAFEVPPQNPLLSLAFSPDGRYLAISGNQLSRLVITEANSGNTLFETTAEVEPGIAQMVFTPDGRSIILACSDTAHLRVRNPLYRPSGDVDGNGCVDDADLLRVLLVFGQTGNLAEDLNQDGIINDIDLLTVLLNFSNGC
jgi:probable HAF family extracellular repeat protein